MLPGCEGCTKAERTRLLGELDRHPDRWYRQTVRPLYDASVAALADWVLKLSVLGFEISLVCLFRWAAMTRMSSLLVTPRPG